jgi:hypothetical protein
MNRFITFIVFIIILIITLSLLKITFFNKERTNETTIESYTKELFTIIESLKNVKCITPSILQMNNKIILNNTDSEKIFSETLSNGKAPSPEIIKKYKDQYKLYTDIYSTLKDCSDYCVQGDLSSGNCICPSKYPLPIQYNDKVYCYEEDCTQVPNSVFVPSNSNDPSQNKCECKDGYIKDPNNKFNCKKIINCSMSDWEYGECDLATGFKYKSRKVLVVPENGGTVCPSNLKNVGDTEKVLSDVICPVDCVLNDWPDTWSECDPNTGTQTKTATVKYSSKNGGLTCPSATKTQTCPVDCVLNDLPDTWSECDPNTGTQTKTATVKYSSKNGGLTCPSATKTQTCPVDCQYTWSNWTNCTADCGTGYQYRTPNITVNPKNGGAKCPSGPTYTACTFGDPTCRTCNNQQCVPVNCEYTWSDWSPCSKTCGGGTQNRNIIITKYPQNFGNSCPDPVQTQTCNSSPCFPLGTTGVLTVSSTGQIPQGTFQNMRIELIGGGGYGGYSYNFASRSTCGPGGGGGGAGEYRLIDIPYDPSLNGSTYNYTIGGATSDTVFNMNSNTYIAKGGFNGGNATSSKGGIGGAGGAGGTGGIGTNGANGANGAIPYYTGCGGNGGSTIFGSGGGGCGYAETIKKGKGAGAGGGGSCACCMSGTPGTGIGGGIRITYT